MAKRFISTELWGEDWFLEMPAPYKLFWYYLISNCDHAGLYKVNMRTFSLLNEVSLTSTDAINYINKGKNRIRVISESTWFIEDFFVFQYGTTFNTGNKVHVSIEKLYKRYEIELTSLRGLKEVKQGLKEKDKDSLIGETINSLNNEKNKKNEISNFATAGHEILAKKLQG